MSALMATAMTWLAFLTTADGAIEPDRQRLEADVTRLASAEFQGRSGEGARAAGDLLIDRLRDLGLEPAFGEKYEQEFTAGDLDGRNIAARLPGLDPALDDWIVVSSHYDHLGRRGDTFYPGADDNATGVAMVLEVARCLVEAPERPARGVFFVFFDLEEKGLLGSQQFARTPPVPLDRIGLFLTADMLGRSLAGICDEFLFVMGTEHAPGLRPWVTASAEGLPIRVGTIGADVLVIDRSDYGPFRWREVPFLFFSTGESPDYHTVRDLAKSINYPKLTAGVHLILRVARQAAEAPTLPDWSDERTPWLDEAETIRAVFSRLLDRRDEIKLPTIQKTMVRSTISRIDDWLAAGSLTADQRQHMVRVAQFVLFTTF